MTQTTESTNASVGRHVQVIVDLNTRLSKTVRQFNLDMGEQYSLIKKELGTAWSAWMRRQDKLTGIGERTAYRYYNLFVDASTAMPKAVLEVVKSVAPRTVKAAALVQAAKSEKNQAAIKAAGNDLAKLQLVGTDIARDAASVVIPAVSRKAVSPKDRAERIYNSALSAMGKAFTVKDNDNYDEGYAVKCGIAFADVVGRLASEWNLEALKIHITVPSASRTSKAA